MKKATKKIGRPKKDETLSKRISTNLKEKEYEEFEMCAEECQRTMSDLNRIAILELTERWRQKKK